MKAKKIIALLLGIFLTSSSAFANFIGAKIKVTGVTCSMCSNSVNKALSSLKFVEKIEVDLENAIFSITFKPNEKVAIDEIKAKVEGAGFSVGELIADFKFDNLTVSKDYHYQFENNTYHFVNVKDQNLNKVTSIRFVDKGLTSIKEHKKYVGLTSYKCIKTGKMESCCKVEGNRIYHITL